MSARVMKDEVAESRDPVFTPEERRVLRDVLKRLSDTHEGRAVSVPGDHPLEDVYCFVPAATKVWQAVEPNDPRVDWDEHRRRLAHPEEFVNLGEFTMAAE